MLYNRKKNNDDTTEMSKEGVVERWIRCAKAEVDIWSIRKNTSIVNPSHFLFTTTSPFNNHVFFGQS